MRQARSHGIVVVAALALVVHGRAAVAQQGATASDEGQVPAERLQNGNTLLLKEAGASIDAPSGTWVWTQLVKEADPGTQTFRCRDPKTRAVFTVTLEPGADPSSADAAVALANRAMRPYAAHSYKVQLDPAAASAVPLPASFKITGQAVGPKATVYVFGYLACAAQRVGFSFVGSKPDEPALFKKFVASWKPLAPGNPATDASPSPAAPANAGKLPGTVPAGKLPGTVPAGVRPTPDPAHLALLESKLNAQREQDAARRQSTEIVLVVLLLLFFGGITLAIVSAIRARNYQAEIPFARWKRIPKVCVFTGTADGLTAEPFKFAHTSGASKLVGVLSLVSIFTGGILYMPGKQRVEVNLFVSDEGRRLRSRAGSMRALSLLSIFGFFVGAIVLGSLLGGVGVSVCLVGMVAAPIAISTLLIAPGQITCVGMTKETIWLQFSSKEIAAQVKTAFQSKT